MKTFPHLILSMLFSLVLFLSACGTEKNRGPSPSVPLGKYQINGISDDWGAETLVTDELGGIGRGTFGKEIDIKSVHVDVDKDYLYVFLACEPTIEEYAKSDAFSGILAYLYVDNDRDSKTGASVTDSSGNDGMHGAEFQIWVPITSWANLEGGKAVSGISVSYSLNSWNSKTNDFDRQIREEGATDDGALIAEGRDGVEMAVPLNALGLASGENFDFLALEWATNRESEILKIEITMENE
jgi:hypothetical protein